MNITLNINKKSYRCEVDSNAMLVDTLRSLGFKSVKRGCDTANCGACSVLVDDRVVLSCAQLTARTADKMITTLEGIQRETMVFTELFAAEGAEQCGFCGTGLTMAVISLQRNENNPSEETILRYLDGNLCRCSGYVGQMRAIKKFLEVSREIHR